MKKNLKKITAVGLTALLGAGLLAGCGGDGKSGGSKDGKVELVMSVWDSDQQPVMKKWQKHTTKSIQTLMSLLSLQPGPNTGQNWKQVQQAEVLLTSSQ